MKEFNLKIHGYYRDSNKDVMPDTPGIYFVYRTIYDEANNTESIKELLFIGGGASIREHVMGHERYSFCKEHLQAGEELCYSYAELPAADTAQVEAALIHQHRPPVDTLTATDKIENAGFRFEDTHIQLSGRTNHLDTDFTVTHEE